MLESTRLIKFSKEGQYGPMIFLQDDANEFSAPDKDWCVFVDAKCDMAGVNWEKGNTITFSYTESSKNGRVSYYVKTMKNEAQAQQGDLGGSGQQQRMATSGGYDPSKKDRQIFIQGVFQQMCMGAASGAVSEESLDAYYAMACKYWQWFGEGESYKPGDAPQAENNGFPEDRY